MSNLFGPNEDRDTYAGTDPFAVPICQHHINVQSEPQVPTPRLQAINAKTVAKAIIASRAKMYWHKGKFYEWADKKIYRPVDDSAIDQEIYRVLDVAFKRNTLGEVRRAMELECYDRENLIGQRHDNLMALENGMLNIETGELMKHDPKYGAVNLIPIAYAPTATCPVFQRCLTEWVDDPAARNVLVEWLGYTLTSNTKMDKALVLIGDGGNGKGRFIRVNEHLVGEANRVSIPLPALCAERTFPTAGLEHKLLNAAPEWEGKKQLDEGWIKGLISGDEITVERKNRNEFKMNPIAKFIIQTNNPPQWRDKTDGIWRRMLVIRFTATFDESTADLGLDMKLEGELPGILNLALVGLRRLRTQGKFSSSDTIRSAVKEYRAECNPVQAWIEERTKSSSGWVAVSEAYDNYRGWCERCGYRSLSINKFSREVQRLKIGKEDAWDANLGKTVKAFLGIEVPNSFVNDGLSSGQAVTKEGS